MGILFTYVGVVIAIGAALLATFSPAETPQASLTLTLTAAMLVVSLFKLRLPLAKDGSTVSMAFAVDFVALMTAGVDVAMAIAVVGVLVQCCVRARNPRWYKVAFSMATVAIAVQVAGAIWTGLNGSIADATVAATVVPLAIAAAAYFAVNAALVAIAVTLAQPGTAMADAGAFVATAPAYVIAALSVGAAALMLQPYAMVLWIALAVGSGYGVSKMLFDRMAAQQGTMPGAAGV
jgi:hypothetical protein